MRENLKSKKELMKDLIANYDLQESYEKSEENKAKCKILGCHIRMLEIELKGVL